MKTNAADAAELPLRLLLPLDALAYALYLHMHYDRHPLPAGKH